MKMKELYSPGDWALVERFRKLPSPEKEEVQNEACNIVKDICKTFPKIVMDMNGFNLETKRSVVEGLFGPIGQTREEAMKDGSKFSRFYNLTLVAAVIEVMKGRNNDHKKKDAKATAHKKARA